MKFSRSPDYSGGSNTAWKMAVAVAVVVWAEALVLIVFATLDLVNMTVSRFAVGLGGALLLGGYGIALAFAAWNFLHLHEWTRGLIVFTQLVMLGLAWNLRDVDPGWLAPVLALIAAVVLVCMFARPVTRAFGTNRSV